MWHSHECASTNVAEPRMPEANVAKPRMPAGRMCKHECSGAANAGGECCEATNALWASVFDLQHLTLNSFRFEVSSASQL